VATKIDYSKYVKSFLSVEDIKCMASQLCRTDLGFVATVLVSLRAAALAALYWMHDREWEKQLLLAKQKLEQELQDDVDNDNNVVS
jgi:ABC-type polysaccharide transport system permease subunit